MYSLHHNWFEQVLKSQINILNSVQPPLPFRRTDCTSSGSHRPINIYQRPHNILRLNGTDQMAFALTLAGVNPPSESLALEAAQTRRLGHRDSIQSRDKGVKFPTPICNFINSSAAGEQAINKPNLLNANSCV